MVAAEAGGQLWIAMADDEEDILWAEMMDKTSHTHLCVINLTVFDCHKAVSDGKSTADVLRYWTVH